MSTESKPPATTWNTQIDKQSGEFVRKATTFRNWITSDPSSEFPAQEGRYHLYISYACPWASRTLMVRALKGLEHAISFDVVHPFLDQQGWSFAQDETLNVHGDSVNGFKRLREIYFKADPNYVGSFTVPVLWDKEKKVIVNNESSEIIRMLNSEFNQFAKHPKLDFYPESLKTAIDEVNEWIYPNINNGVYRCGFAKSQEAYNIAYHDLFDSLDRVEKILSTNRYLTGNQLTEADIRLFATLVRFDPVYVVHFKCNKRRLTEYPNIWGFTREIYQLPEIAKTVNMIHIKMHYYTSHLHINPTGIIPGGMECDFTTPHGREKL